MFAETKNDRAHEIALMKQDKWASHPPELQFVPGKILHKLLATEICYKYQST
jgi:hypothetical protein